jgi:CubicO group peptidase (beta-lactamase class C family)
MRHKSIAILLVVSASVMTSPALSSRALQSATWRADVDKVFAPWDTRESPGCALAVYRNGAIQYEHGYGMADLEHDVSITPETVFYIGSVSKQFTAFAAALAIQYGKLGLDDSIRRYAPELPDNTASITVRNLIHHTSGLRDFYTLLTIAGRRQDALYDNFAVLQLAARQNALNFPPGEDYLYSNTGYALLATIVGRAMGPAFGAFVDASIFTPLGMTSSHVHDDDARLVKGRAYGYSRTAAGGLRLDTPAGERVGAGGVFTTVRDLLKWDENFYTGRVGGRALIEQVQTPGTLNNGRALTYAWGLEIGRYRGQRIVEHGGSLGGYRAHLVRFPDQHFSVACLCNLGSIAPGSLARQVADIMLTSAFTEPAPAAGQRGAGPGRGGAAASTPPTLTPSALAAYAGSYYSDEINSTFNITVQDGRLSVRRDTSPSAAMIEPVSADQFRFGSLTLRFTRGSNGNIDALQVDAGRVRGIRFARREGR